MTVTSRNRCVMSSFWVSLLHQSVYRSVDPSGILFVIILKIIIYLFCIFGFCERGNLRALQNWPQQSHWVPWVLLPTVANWKRRIKRENREIITGSNKYLQKKERKILNGESTWHSIRSGNMTSSESKKQRYSPADCSTARFLAYPQPRPFQIYYS